MEEHVMTKVSINDLADGLTQSLDAEIAEKITNKILVPEDSSYSDADHENVFKAFKTIYDYFSSINEYGDYSFTALPSVYEPDATGMSQAMKTISISLCLNKGFPKEVMESVKKCASAHLLVIEWRKFLRSIHDDACPFVLINYNDRRMYIKDLNHTTKAVLWGSNLVFLMLR